MEQNPHCSSLFMCVAVFVCGCVCARAPEDLKQTSVWDLLPCCLLSALFFSTGSDSYFYEYSDFGWRFGVVSPQAQLNSWRVSTGGQTSNDWSHHWGIFGSLHHAGLRLLIRNRGNELWQVLVIKWKKTRKSDYVCNIWRAPACLCNINSDEQERGG